MKNIITAYLVVCSLQVIGSQVIESEKFGFSSTVEAFQLDPVTSIRTKQCSRNEMGCKRPSPQVFEKIPSMNEVALMAGKNENADSDEERSPKFWDEIGKKPGNLVILPFVLLFGIDLLLNIIFLTKRSFEFFVLGQAPSTDTWW